MTNLRKAAEMALDALRYTCDYLPAKTGVERDVDDAITALQVALMQPEQEPLGGEWVPCVKLPGVVHVRNQRDGETHISTREGITPVLAEDLIMRGVVGEEYPIGRELFEHTYTFDTKPPKREWVGLTDEKRGEAVMKELTAYDRFQERQRIAEEQHIKREMTNLRKAAEQALKMLEEINEISKPPTGLPLPAEIDGAMENLRQALAEQDPAKESA